MEPDEVRLIADLPARIRAANEAISPLAQRIAEYAAIRRGAVREMRQTMSYGDVARTLGVSRTRVQQLER